MRGRRGLVRSTENVIADKQGQGNTRPPIVAAGTSGGVLAHRHNIGQGGLSAESRDQVVMYELCAIHRPKIRELSAGTLRIALDDKRTVAWIPDEIGHRGVEASSPVVAQPLIA